MAGPTQETQATLSFKKLVGKAHTSNNTPFYSESISSQISIDSSEVLGEDIPTNPQTAVDNGIGEFVELDLQEISASNGLAFNLRFPSDYSGDFGTAVQGDLVRNHTQIIDQKNNRADGKVASDNSGGYVYDLRDGTGAEIPEGASENWQLDPVGGIIVSEQEITDLTSNSGTVKVYVFTGNLLEDRLSGIEGGNVTVEDDGTQVVSDAKTFDFGTLAGVTDNGSGDVTIDVNDDLSQYDFTSISTDDLSEGSNNLYFTDERAQDAVGGILGTNFTYTDNDAGNDAITLTNDSVTVAGNTVSLGGSTTIDHADLSNVDADADPHTEYVLADGTRQFTGLPSVTSAASTPSNSLDLTTKSYVDDVAQGLEIKDSVDAATDGTNVDLTSTTDPNPIDGVTLADGEFVLLKDQTTASENGIYVANTATDPSTWTRRADFDDDAEVVAGSITFVERGTANADVSYIVTSDDPIAVGTDPIEWTIFAKTGTIKAGDGLFRDTNELSVVASDLTGTNVTVETGGDGNDNLAVTDEAIQDAVYENVLSGPQSLITVAYDDANNEVDYTVESDLSQYSFTNVTTDDISEGTNNLYYTSTRVKDEFQAGGDITYNKNLASSYDIANASYTNNSFSAGTQVSGSGQETAFNNDGTKAYVVDSNGTIFEYDLGIAFDISTATYNTVSLDVSTQDTSPTGLAFNGDGTKLFVSGGSSEAVYEYDLSTGFDLSTATYNSASFSVSTQTTGASDIRFNSDGTKMFILDRLIGVVFEYDLSTGFDVTTATYNNSSFNFAESGTSRGFDFNGDGTALFMVGLDEVVYKYSLSTAFDVTTLSYTGTSFDVSSQVNTGDSTGLIFGNSGTEMYVTEGRGAANIFQYSVGNLASTAEFTLDVSNLSASDLFGSKTTDDLPEGSTNLYFTDERAQDAVGTIISGTSGITVTYDDNNDAITVDGSGAAASVSNGGTEVVNQATDLNFGRNLTATDDGDGTATITSDVKLNNATFSGDGIQKEFNIAHGLSSAPSSWTVHATSDAASGISHSTADATNITVVYDTAPPNDTDNITVNYVYEE